MSHDPQQPAPPKSGPCVSCGKITEWACADCRIDLRLTVYVCESSDCRDKHESGAAQPAVPSPRSWPEVVLTNPTLVAHGELLHDANEPCYECGTMKVAAVPPVAQPTPPRKPFGGDGWEHFEGSPVLDDEATALLDELPLSNASHYKQAHATIANFLRARDQKRDAALGELVERVGELLMQMNNQGLASMLITKVQAAYERAKELTK